MHPKGWMVATMRMALDEVLKTIGDISQGIPVTRFAELSDLDREELARFAQTWGELPVERRRDLTRLLGEEAYAHVELNFDEIYRSSLEDPDSDVRQAAIGNLWECEDPSLIAPFLQALTSDPATNVRASAAAALGRFVLLGEVERIGPDTLHDIEETLLAAAGPDQAPEIRRAAIESLGYSSRQEVPQIILLAHESGEESSVVSSLVAIGRSANDDWRPQVLAHLNDPSPKIRLAATRASGELELIDTAPDLIELIEDADNEVRQAAIWSLGQLGGEIAKQALTELLETSEDDEEVQLVQDAVDNLAFVDGTRDLLILDFDEPDPE